MLINNGGPAYPYKYIDTATGMENIYSGMTLRQWYAGMAMQGLISNSNESLLRFRLTESANKGETRIIQTFVRLALEAADEMIKQEEA